MRLRDWRLSQDKTLRQMADDLGIGEGKNPSRRVQRIETGESHVDVLLADRIVEMTGGQVSLSDLNDQRRDFLSGASAAVEAAV